MMINVAGPYSASSEDGRRENLERLNRAAAEVLARGHVPVIGVNAALGVVAHLPEDARYEAMMRISLALVEKCDGLLVLSTSPGVERERALAVTLGIPVYESIEDLPAV